jgi:hypothetical protein
MKKKEIVAKHKVPIADNKSRSSDSQNVRKKNLIAKNVAIKERLVVVDKILKMFPHLKKERAAIVDNVLNNTKQKINSYILEKISFDDISCYRDLYGNVMDKNTNLIGIYEETDTHYIYHLFDDIAKINKNLITSTNKFLI